MRANKRKVTKRRNKFDICHSRLGKGHAVKFYLLSLVDGRTDLDVREGKIYLLRFTLTITIGQNHFKTIDPLANFRFAESGDVDWQKFPRHFRR